MLRCGRVLRGRRINFLLLSYKVYNALLIAAQTGLWSHQDRRSITSPALALSLPPPSLSLSPSFLLYTMIEKKFYWYPFTISPGSVALPAAEGSAQRFSPTLVSACGELGIMAAVLSREPLSPTITPGLDCHITGQLVPS